jgi:hypothetical protein
MILIDRCSAHDALSMHIGDDRQAIIGQFVVLHACTPPEAYDDLRAASLVVMQCHFQTGSLNNGSFPIGYLNICASRTEMLYYFV